LDDFGKSPLYLAVEKGHPGVIELLCQSGASPDLNNSNSDTTPRKLAASKSMDMNLFNVGPSSGAPVVIEPAVPVVPIEVIGSINIDLYAAFGGKENFLARFGQGGSINVSVDPTGVSVNAGDENPDTQ
jgi:ankyrin repeat protein